MEERKEKKCTRCKEVKQVTEFNRNKNTNDKLHYYCKICSRIISKKHYEISKDENYKPRVNLTAEEKKKKAKIARKKLYENNKEAFYNRKKIWIEKNKEWAKEYHTEYMRIYRAKNKEEIKVKEKEWYLKNREEILIRIKTRYKNKKELN